MDWYLIVIKTADCRFLPRWMGKAPSIAPVTRVAADRFMDRDAPTSNEVQVWKLAHDDGPEGTIQFINGEPILVPNNNKREN